MSPNFHVLSRKALGTPECPEAVVELAGTTGNIYTVRIERIPSCSCPYNENGYGSQCKHIIYVWNESRVSLYALRPVHAAD